MPVVSGFADAEFERALNGRIVGAGLAGQGRSGALCGNLHGAGEGGGDAVPYDCVYSAWYEVKCCRGILSLKLTTFLDNGGTGMPHTVYYNADIARCEMLLLGDLFASGEYRERIDAVIDAELRQGAAALRRAVQGRNGCGARSSFVFGGKLYIAFAKYEVASGMTGEPEFEIPADAVRDILKARYAKWIIKLDALQLLPAEDEHRSPQGSARLRPPRSSTRTHHVRCLQGRCRPSDRC